MDKFENDYVKSMVDSNESPDEEMRIYTLINNPNKPLHETNESELENFCYVYLQPLPTLNDREIIVQMKLYAREDPEVKSLEWMKQKTELEKTMADTFEETLLVSGNNSDEIYEGLSSNFFVIRNGCLYVAPEGTILLGTIMKHVLDACEKLNITVIREPPSLKYLDEWSSCFITSTSRLVLPIQKICFPDHPSIPEKLFTTVPQDLQNIKNCVQRSLEEKSFDIRS